MLTNFANLGQLLRCILFAILINCSNLNSLIAQITGKANFEVTSGDKEANPFFLRNSDISYLDIEYKNDVPRIVNIYHKGKPDTYFYQYNLSFDGDRYLFAKKYGQIIFPETAQLKMNYLTGVALSNTTTMYSLHALVRPDSITRRFIFYTVSPNTRADLDPSKGPYFKGDITKLTNDLNQRLAELNLKPDAPMAIYQGLVDKQGGLGTLKLIEGRKSKYTENALNFLQKEAIGWIPRLEGSGKIPWKIRISVMPTNDRSIRVSIL